jgi:hypothetical protein
MIISSLSVYERVAQVRHLQIGRLPVPSTTVINFERSDVGPVGEFGGYDLANPPMIEFTEFVYTPPPIKDLVPYKKPYERDP